MATLAADTKPDGDAGRLQGFAVNFVRSMFCESILRSTARYWWTTMSVCWMNRRVSQSTSDNAMAASLTTTGNVESVEVARDQPHQFLVKFFRD